MNLPAPQQDQPTVAEPSEDVVRAVENARVILAMTDDGNEQAYATSRAVAVDLARRAGARLLLLDRSAASALSDPYGRGPFTSDNETWSSGEQPLRRNEAEALGRHYLNEQIDLAGQSGVEAQAWMPHGSGAGADDVGEALSRFDVDVVVAPADARQSVIEKVKGGGWMDNVRKMAGDRPLVLVEPDGTARLEPHGGRG